MKIKLWLKLFKEIPWFKKYYYEQWNDNEELDCDFSVMMVLAHFTRDNYLDKNYRIIWDKQEYKKILHIIDELITSNNIENKNLALIGFIEWISQSVNNNEEMLQLKESLILERLKNWLDQVNKFWAW
jgi:hypothetical protein